MPLGFGNGTIPTLIFEVGFTSDPLSTVSWTDITARVRSFKTTTGRQHELNRVEAGTLEAVLEDRNRDFDPTNTSSPYYNSGTGLVPMRPVRVRATWSGTTYAVWYGYVDAWVPQWPDETSSDVVLRASDGLKILALKNITSSAYSSQVTTDGATGYWRLGDAIGSSTAADSSGNSHTGSVAGGGAFGQASALVADSGTSYATNGTGFIAIASPPSLSATSYTIEAWVKPSTNSTTGKVPLFTLGSTSSQQVQIAVNYDGTGSGYGAAVVDTGGSGATGSVLITDGAWHHLVVTMSIAGGNYTGTLYVDGAQSGLQFTGAYTAPTGSWGIPGPNGATGIGAGVQDAAYYPSILSGAQIANHYQLGVGAWAVQYSGQRISTVLNTIGVPAGFQSVATGISQVQAATTSLASTKALSYIQTCETSEGGIFYQDPSGVFQFKDRHYTITATASNTSQATFADDSVGGHFHYLPPLQVTMDDLDLWNEVIVQRSGGVTQSATDATSQTHYQKRTLSRTGQLQTSDADALAQAQYLLSRYKTPVNRVAAITTGSEVDAGAGLPQMLGRSLWDRVTVTRTLMVPHTGVAFTQPSLIEGIEHQMDAKQGRWMTTFHLSAADAASNWLILDDPVYGKLDSNQLAY